MLGSVELGPLQGPKISNFGKTFVKFGNFNHKQIRLRRYYFSSCALLLYPRTAVFCSTGSKRDVQCCINFVAHRYQAAHIRTRNSVERAFGVWKRRFPCLDMRLQHKPERSTIIITACAALHNLACQRNDPCPPARPIPPIPLPRHRRRRHVLPVILPKDSANGPPIRTELIARAFS